MQVLPAKPLVVVGRACLRLPTDGTERCVDVAQPEAERREGVGHAPATRVVEVDDDRILREARREQLTVELADLARVGDPRRVAEADVRGADVAPPLAEADDLGDRYVPLDGAAEARQHPAEDLVPRVDGTAGHGFEGGLIVGARRLDVGLVVRLARGDDHGQLVDAEALALRRNRPLDPLGRRAEAAVVDARTARDQAQDLLGVGELRQVLGVREAGGLDAREAGGQDAREHLDLLRRGDDLGLVLEAVARPALAHDDLFGKRAFAEA